MGCERMSSRVYEGHRFNLRFFRPFRADLSIKKSSSFFPPLIASTSHLGFAPRPAQVSPEWLRYLGGTFLPFNLNFLGRAAAVAKKPNDQKYLLPPDPGND